MDAELVALASTAGSAVVTLLATDAWLRAKAGMGALWRRVYPDRAEVIEAEIVEAREEVVAARTAGDDTVEQALVGEWQGRLRRLLASHPDLAAELRRLLDEELTLELPAGDRTWGGDVDMRAEASGHGRVYQVGQGEMTIGER
jgi:hypothetical protein